jgi:hypothetical protein
VMEPLIEFKGDAPLFKHAVLANCILDALTSAAGGVAPIVTSQRAVLALNTRTPRSIEV